MSNRFFKVFKGSQFESTRTLILSESTYDWSEGDVTFTPQPDHPETSLKVGIETGKIAYFKRMGQALCESYNPSPQEQRNQWERFAYSVYVQESVGHGAGVRPSPQQWSGAAANFKTLLEELRPAKVILTGRDMWERGGLPDGDEWLLNDLQAYRLEDKTLVWCLALPHTANRREGFNFEFVGASIRNFVASSFPL